MLADILLNKISYLNIIFIFPLVCAILIPVIKMLNEKILYKTSLNLSAFSFILSCLLYYSYIGLDFNDNVQNLEDFNPKFKNRMYFTIIPSFFEQVCFGIDSISIFFVILTNLFIYLCILSLNKQTDRLAEALFYLFFLQ
jgi:NADH:ubiquinone oxidoreductase subunit 4 (subunit M)